MIGKTDCAAGKLAPLGGTRTDRKTDQCDCPDGEQGVCLHEFGRIVGGVTRHVRNAALFVAALAFLDLAA